jgi:uncharacterized metal-binding protein YceD (DUF177 family)
MKIKQSDLKKYEPFQLTSPDQAWWEELLSPLKKEGMALHSKPELKAHLLLIDGDGVSLQGDLRVELRLPCSRCNDGIPWVLENPVRAFFGPDQEGAEEEELYPVGKDGFLSLREPIWEAISLNLPDRRVPECKADGSCSVCGCDLSSPLVYGSP